MAETAYKYDYGYENNAAVKREKKQQVKTQPKLEVIVNPLAKEIAREREVNKLAIKVSALFAVALVLFSVFCYSFVLISDAQHTLKSCESDLLIHQTKNLELKTQLNSLVASVDIDKFAVEELGLVKVSAENEVYLSKDAGNKIIYSAVD